MPFQILESATYLVEAVQLFEYDAGTSSLPNFLFLLNGLI